MTRRRFRRGRRRAGGIGVSGVHPDACAGPLGPRARGRATQRLVGDGALRLLGGDALRHADRHLRLPATSTTRIWPPPGDRPPRSPAACLPPPHSSLTSIPMSWPPARRPRGARRRAVWRWIRRRSPSRPPISPGRSSSTCTTCAQFTAAGQRVRVDLLHAPRPPTSPRAARDPARRVSVLLAGGARGLTTTD